jgi:hypothetical protein
MESFEIYGIANTQTFNNVTTNFHEHECTTENFGQQNNDVEGNDVNHNTSVIYDNLIVAPCAASCQAAQLI